MVFWLNLNIAGVGFHVSTNSYNQRFTLNTIVKGKRKKEEEKKKKSIFNKNIKYIKITQLIRKTAILHIINQNKRKKYFKYINVAVKILASISIINSILIAIN